MAAADLWAEWVLALCSTLALSAVMAPLIVLAGLRAGLVEGLRQTLLDNPHAREIITAANRRYDSELLASLSRRPDVAFVAPKTRTLNASLLVELPDQPGEGIRVELVPTGPGDPLVPAFDAPQSGSPNQTVVLSASAAARLHVSPGQQLLGRLGRKLREGDWQTVTLPLNVAAVAPAAVFERDGAFVALELATFVEDYLEGEVGPPDNPREIHGLPHRDFPGFRLYARRLEEVPALDAFLRAQGIDVVSHVGEVEGILRTDRSLGLLFALVAGLGGTGFLVSLGAGLWANVDRKRMPLALLRFLGLSSAALALFPVAQACVLAAIGSAAAVVGAVTVSGLINGLFAGTLQLERPLCVISPLMAVAALVVAISGAALVATAAGYHAAKVEPWEGVTPP